MARERSVILAIETSNPSSRYVEGDGPGVAFGKRRSGADGVEVLGFEALKPNGPNDDDLMSAIDRLARRIGVVPAEIGRVAVSVGPGGYTAMRIAIASAKMIAEGSGAEIVAVPTANVAARLASSQAASGRFAVALASKGEHAHVTVFGPDRLAEQQGWVAAAADIQDILDGNNPVRTLIADQFLPKGFCEVLADHRGTLESLRLTPSACLDASCGFEPLNAAALTPLYAREPEAVTLWRARHPRI